MLIFDNQIDILQYSVQAWNLNIVAFVSFVAAISSHFNYVRNQMTYLFLNPK